MSRESGTLYVGNLPGDIRQQDVEDLICNGHKIEKSVKLPLSSINGSVQDTKGIVSHKDDYEKSVKLEQSSESIDSLTPVADSGIAQRPIQSDGNVIDSVREVEAAHIMASPSIINVAANTHEVIKPQIGNSDDVPSESGEHALDLNAEQGTENVPSCLTGSDAASTKEVSEQNTEVEYLKGSVSSLDSCSRLQHMTELVNGTTVAGVDSTSSSIDKLITSADFELESPCLQYSESTEEVTLVADSSIVQGSVGCNESVVDAAREHETKCKASPSVEDVAANTHEITEAEKGIADNAAVGCDEDGLVLTIKRGQEQVSSCLTGNDVSTVGDVIQQETEPENLEGAVSTSLSCSELKPITQDINDTAVAGGDNTSFLMDKVSGSIHFELGTPGPQACERTDVLTSVADSSIVQRSLESDESFLDTAREHETECKRSPSVENFTEHTHEIIELERGDAANVAVGCVEDAPVLTTENGTEQVSSCFTGNVASTVTKVTEQEIEAENHETAVSTSVNSSKLNPLTDDVTGAAIAGVDRASCLIDQAVSSRDHEVETPSHQSSETTDSLTVVAVTNIVHRPLEIDDSDLDTTREHESQCRASPSVENVAASTHETIKPETVDADNIVAGCVEDAPVLATECGAEQVSSCLTGIEASTFQEVTEQEMEVDNFEAVVSTPVSCLKLKPTKEAVSDTDILGGDSTGCSIDKVNSNAEIESEETRGPQFLESADSLMVMADTYIVHKPVEIDDSDLDIAREHHTQCRASPSMENVAADTHEIIKPQTGDADEIGVGCVEGDPVLDTECGTEQVPSCLAGNDASAVTEVTEQEMEVDNYEGDVSTSVSCLKLKPTREAVNDPDIAGGDSTGYSTDKVISSTEMELEEISGLQSSERTDTFMVMADTNIVQRPVEVDDSDFDTARKYENQSKTSPSMENVAADTHEIINPQTGDADNIAVGCVEGDPVLATECGAERVPSCLVENDASNVTEVTEQEMEIDDCEGGVSTPDSCLQLKPTTEAVNDTYIAGGDGTNCLTDKVISSTEIELEETPGPQYSESTDGSMVMADSDIVQRPVESDETSLNTSSKHDEYKASPSTENIIANTHEINRPDTEDSDKAAVECVEHAFCPTTEQGPEHSLSCLTENEAPTSKDLVEQETETSGAQDVLTLQGDNDHINTKISAVDDESSDVQTVLFRSKKEFEVGNHSVISSTGDMICNDVSSESEVSDSFATKDKLLNSIPDNVDKEIKGVHLAGAHVRSDDELICLETNEVENSLKSAKSTSLLGNSSAGAVALHDVVEPFTRPFRYLIRMPRFEDSKMKEQIRKAQLQVEEKTQYRDALRIEVQKYKANCLGYAAEYDAAMSESRTLKKSVRSKRAEIDSLQSVMNKVKNAMSVEDIDNRIHSMEHMIAHETVPLKEEKLLIREIKQLKQVREQLSSNIGSHDELQQALNNRDQIEERLKVLKKELEIQKDSVVKADAVVRALEKKYEDESRKLKEVQTRYAAANNIRQDAYAHLQSLRRQLYEKNQQFRMYKDSAAAAGDFAAKQDREGLHHLCVNQVESIMELWNQNNEFRKEYVRCNLRSTLRRLGTMDGRSLGPNEQPHVFSNYEARADRFVSNPINSRVNLQMENLEQDVVVPLQDVTSVGKMKVEVSEQQTPATGLSKLEKHIQRNDLAAASGRGVSEDIVREEQHMLTQEELDAARKVEELRREEEEAKMREQRRLEEKAKALEALERKKRNAEKAQMKAELRAQKEAEQREKEREKRLRKKERRKGGGTDVSDGSNSAEATPNCESMSETTMEPETKENLVAVSKRPQKVSQFTKQSKGKSIPPPLRNRGRKKIQQWMWLILTCVLVVALFLLGNVGFFSNLSNIRRRNSGF